MKYLTALVVVTSLFIGGCWDNIDIRDRAMVIGMGIDQSDDGQILLCLLLAVPAATEGEQTDESVLVCGTGTTPASARRSIQMRLPRQLFLGQTQAIILSEQIARDPQLMSKVIDDLLREPFLNRKAFLTVARDVSPADILRAQPPLEDSPALFIASAHDRVRQNLMHPRTELWEFHRALTSPGWDPMAVGVTASEDQLDLSGLALFADYQLVGWLGTFETRGLMWLLGQGDGSTVTITTDQGITEIAITKVRLLPRPPPADIISCRIKVIGNLVVVPTDIDTLTAPNFRQLEQTLAAAVHAEANTAITIMQQLGSDATGIGRQIYYRSPYAWADINWRQDFPRTTIRTEVTATITRRGALN